MLVLRQQTDAGLVDDFAQPARPKSVRAKVPHSGRIPWKGPKRKGDEPAVTPGKAKKKKLLLEPVVESEP